MKPTRMPRFAVLLAALSMVLSMVVVDHADARRGGSFGSRGLRTFQSAPATRTAPQPTAPVERSMSPNPGPGAATNAVRQQQTSGIQRPGFLNGFGGSMLRGLAIGGLIGLLLGHGFGGLAGMFGMLLQVAIIAGLAMLALRFFRSRQEPAMAGAGAPSGGFGRNASDFPRERENQPSTNLGGFRVPNIGGGAAAASVPTSSEFSVEQSDLDMFERLLTEVQETFGAEDHAGLRRLVTPEMVSFLSEELADNARNGVRNEVSDVHLLQADIAESWSEGTSDYATAALMYESRDVVRNRATGAVVSGDATRPTEVTELWTFVREYGGDWKLSAIQETSA